MALDRVRVLLNITLVTLNMSNVKLVTTTFQFSFAHPWTQ